MTKRGMMMMKRKVSKTVSKYSLEVLISCLDGLFFASIFTVSIVALRDLCSVGLIEGIQLLLTL